MASRPVASRPAPAGSGATPSFASSASAPAGAAESAPRASASPDPWADMARRQMEWPLLALIAVVRGAEAVRTVQLNYAHLTRQHHEEALARVAAAKDLPQMWAAQAELLRFDAAGATRYWQELFDAWAHAGQDVWSRMVCAADRSAGDPLLAGFLGWQGCLHSGISPMDDLFNAPYSQALHDAAPPSSAH